MLQSRGLYREWLTKYFSTVSLAGLTSDDEPILLRKIYVPLVLTPEKIAEHEPEERIHHGGAGLPEWLSRRDSQGPNVFLISGEAGSGKTTLVAAVVDSFAGKIGDDLNRRFRGFVPFPIRLRDAPIESLKSLDGLVDWSLHQTNEEVPGMEPEALRAFLDGGQGILLLDGLDEVGSLSLRSRVMRWLWDHPWVRGDYGSFGNDEMSILRGTLPNVVIVTARPSGFEGLGREELSPYRHSLFVAPFSHEQIGTYLTRWFELRPLQSDERENTVDALVKRLTSPEETGRLLPLARRPAYLASLAFVHGTRGKLPYTRAALYEQLVEAYIEMLDRQKGVTDRAERAGVLPIWDRQEKIEVLAAIAFQAHVGATAEQAKKPSWEQRKEDRRFVWTRNQLEEDVLLAVEDGVDRFRTIRPEHASRLTSYFVARTGLLVETRENQYQFAHLSFQEYLTALFILNRATAGSDKAAGLESILFPRLGDSGWLEVGVLALAIDANRSGGKGHEPVLARLDLNKPAHLAFLAQLLSGEEIRFSPGERRAWLLVWLAFWAVRRDSAGLESVLRFPPNHETLRQAWSSGCAALKERTTVPAALSGLVHQALAALKKPAARRSLDPLLGTTGQKASVESGNSAPERVWTRFPNVEDPDPPAAHLLVSPLLGGFLSQQEAKSTLLSLPSRVGLFHRPQSGQVQPTEVQYSLDTWSFRSDQLLLSLAEQTPLLWWLQDEFMTLRIAAVIQATQASAPLILWRGELRNHLLWVEYAEWTALLLSYSEAQAGSAVVRDRARARAWARSREQDWDWARVRAWALDRDLSLDVNLDLDLIRALDKARGLSLELSWVRALDLAQDLDLSRDLARARALDLVQVRALDLAQALDLARDLDRINSAAERRGKSFARNGPFRDQAVNLFQAAIQSTTLCWLLETSFPNAAFADLRTPETVIAPLHGAPLADKARQEWEDVLASSFSPFPALENLPSRVWKELPTDPEGIADLFETALARLEKQYPVS